MTRVASSPRESASVVENRAQLARHGAPAATGRGAVGYLDVVGYREVVPSTTLREEFVPFAAPDIGDAEIEAVVEALRSGWLTTGPRAAAFEAEFAAYLQAMAGERSEATGPAHAVALNSATAGLHLALEACGIGPGDEVIVPTWTFTATAEVVRYLGAEPVIVDVDPDTLNLDLRLAAASVTGRTRALIPVHFAGLPLERTALADLAQAHGLAVVEDAAHCFPASSGGLPVGLGASDAVVFSFYATKTMTTGEGGMMLTHDERLAHRVKTMRLHGISRDVFDRYATPGAAWAYEVVAPGYKYNLTDPAAAMGRVQLARAAAMRDRRAAIAARYDEAFAGLPVRRPAHPPEPAASTAPVDDQILPAAPGDEPAAGGSTAGASADVHAWHLYVLRLTEDAPIGRDAFIAQMATTCAIGCSVHFIPLHRHPYWRERYDLRKRAYPAAESAFAGAVSLPLSSALTDTQVERVIDAVRLLLEAA